MKEWENEKQEDFMKMVNRPRGAGKRPTAVSLRRREWGERHEVVGECSRKSFFAERRGSGGGAGDVARLDRR